MTKNEFVDRLAAQSGMSRREAQHAVDVVLGTIEETLKAGDEITFTGFGKFTLNERAARRGVNPRTREPIQIPASRVPRFSAGAGLKRALGRLPGDGGEEY
jgi:DNA-binding protein HU-beta